MKNILAFVTAAAFAVGSAGAAEPQSVVGFWVTQDHESVVEVAACDSGLCGRLVGLRNGHPPGDVPKDVHNPDPAKRGEPLCGYLLMGSFQPAGGAPKWNGGWIYDPDSGKTYSAQLELANTDTLKLRGYVGIPLFGRSETWTRETGTATPNRCGPGNS